MTKARLAAIVSQMEMALDSRQARALELPGREQHRELLRRAIVQAWITGHQLADEELEAERKARLGRFMGTDPPKTPKPHPGPPPSAAIDWMRKRDVLLGKWDRDLDQAVTAVLVHALETGASKRKVMKALAAVFTEYTGTRLENIARTETSAALTQGRLARFREPGSNVVAVQFVAIMDARTTAICRARDGMILRLDDDRLPGNTPPLHFMCRSTLVAITDWVWADLEAGDEKALRRWFGWLKGEDTPHDLASALGGWAEVPAPLKGFGGFDPAPTKKTPPYNQVFPRPQPGANKVARELLEERRIDLPRSVWELAHVADRKHFGDRLKRVEASIARSLSNFPPTLLRELEKASDAGFKMEMVTKLPYAYVGMYFRPERKLKILLEGLANESGVFEEEIVHLLDHWLGSKGEELYGAFSGGFAHRPGLEKAAAELAELYKDPANVLGEYQNQNSREFLAGAVRFYLTDRELLREVYPSVYTWVKSRWFSEEFWQGTL